MEEDLSDLLPPQSPQHPAAERQWCEEPYPRTMAGAVEKALCDAQATAGDVLQGGFTLLDRGQERLAGAAEQTARGAATGVAGTVAVVGLVGLVAADLWLGAPIMRGVLRGATSLLRGER